MKNCRIAVDLYDIRNIHVGVGEFSYRLGLALAGRAEELKKERDVDFYFFVPAGYKGFFGDKVHYVTVNSVQRVLPFSSLKRFDLFHSTHQYGRINNPVFARRVIQTIHDVNFMYEKHGHKQRDYFTRLRSRIRNAGMLTFISHFVQNDVEKYYGIDKPAVVVYNGVADLTSAAEEYGGDFGEKDYLFHISGLSAKKNVHLLVEMMRYLPDEKLLIAGNWHSAYGKKLTRRIEELQLKNILTAENVDTETKAVMYRNCKGFLFPSLCEGFGLPPVEAMKFGKPVFLSNLSSLPEVGGRHAFYWETLQPEQMAETVKRKLNDIQSQPDADGIRQWAAQFTWERCVDQYIGIYLENIPEFVNPSKR